MTLLVSFPLSIFSIHHVTFTFTSLPHLYTDTNENKAPYASSHRNIGGIVWQQNASFAAEPSPDTEAAWISLMPKGRGFVTHPVLAKEMKSISVFHEIHCLVRFSISLLRCRYGGSVASRFEHGWRANMLFVNTARSPRGLPHKRIPPAQTIPLPPFPLPRPHNPLPPPLYIHTQPLP